MYPLNRELGESQSGSEHFGTEENHLSLPGGEKNFLCCPVPSVFRPFNASLSDIRKQKILFDGGRRTINKFILILTPPPL